MTPNNDNCVNNVTFSNIDFKDPFKAIYIKTNPMDEDKPGTASITNIVYENINIESPIWWAVYIGPQQMKEPDGAGGVRTRTNHSGGIQGGISNGMPVLISVAFKPVATIFREQDTVDASGQAARVKPRGRHDPCVVPRAVPMVEAGVALVLCDHWLRHRAQNTPLT